MKGIEFMVKVQEPPKGGIQIDMSRTVRSLATPEDLALAKKRFDERVAANPKFFDGIMGNVMDSRGKRDVIASNFSLYELFALAWPNGENPYSMQFTNALRTSAVTASLETTDGYVIVQTIPEGIVCPGMIDPTAGGMVPANKETGIIDPRARVISRLEGESQIAPEAIKDLRYTGAHLALDIRTFTDTYVGTTPLTRAEIESKFKAGEESAALHFIERASLLDYIIDHTRSSDRGMLVDDATSTLLAAMGPNEFVYAIEQLRGEGKDIRFGDYIEGKFVEKEAA